MLATRHLTGALTLLTLAAAGATAQPASAAKDLTAPVILGYSVAPTHVCYPYVYDTARLPRRQLTFTLSEPAKVRLTKVFITYNAPFTVRIQRPAESRWSGLLPAGRNQMKSGYYYYADGILPDTEAFSFDLEPDQGWYVLQARDRAGNWSLPVTSGFLNGGYEGGGGVAGTNGCATFR